MLQLWDRYWCFTCWVSSAMHCTLWRISSSSSSSNNNHTIQVNLW